MSKEPNVAEEVTQLRHLVRVLNDKEEIRDIISRYAFTSDLKHIEEFLELWTEDGLFVTDGTGEKIYSRGKEEIRKFLTVVPKYTQHLQLDYLIDVNGDKATAKGYQVITVGQKDGSFGLVRCAIRLFILKRVNSTWLINEARSTAMFNEQECDQYYTFKQK